ncbi:ATP-grasp domain-containing protein [Catellatospora sichuanensis]|uniref:ATP-grasp domain-containing protein n=1 Tax=Catellatospora sichuanensis TaxID=1969805 RepID=UPI00118397AB|nr:ATP-grasp domain-containing protein [Catellatospora sichuanensis]
MKTFVVFELMSQMVLVAQEAKARGFHVVALNHDPLRTTGAFAVPDGVIDELIHIEAWSDAVAVREIIDELCGRSEIVGTYCGYEHTLPYEAELRQRVGLPHNNVQDTLRALDKRQVRRKLYAEGLSRLRSTSLRDALQWDTWQFDGPAVLKPANGTGSVLCFIVGSLAELHAAAAKAEAADIDAPRLRDYIVSRGVFVLEELAAGELLSVESLVSHGVVHTIGLTGRYVLTENPVVEQGLLFPYDHPRRDEIVAACELFHKSLSITHGPTHVEVMVPEHGPIELIDFNLRFAGLAATVLVNEAFGLPFQTYLTDVACGLDLDTTLLPRPTRYAADVLVMPPPGVMHFRDLVFAPHSGTRRLSKEIGQELSGGSGQLDHVAMCVVTGATVAETHDKAVAARQMTVFNGEPLGDIPATRVTGGAYFNPDVRQTVPKGNQMSTSTAPHTVDETLRSHFTEQFSGDTLAAIQAQFQTENVVPLRGFCPPDLLRELQDEAFAIMDGFGKTHKLSMKLTDNTPRQMTTVGQPTIKEHGPLIHELYFSSAMKDLMSQVVGEEAFTCPYAGEHYVISRLGASGDTHGWHWDDYSYGFVLILEAPHYRDGGFVQGVPHTSGWDKANPDVYGALLNGQVHSYAFEAGDAYVIKTDTTMHRVHPIRGEGRRTIVNMTWVNAKDLTTPRTHETNNILFGGAGVDPVSGV